MIIDLHVNVETPEGDVDPSVLARGALDAGLDGYVLTRQGELVPDLEAYRSAGRELGLSVFAGAEISTNHGLILCILPDGTALADDFAPKDGPLFDAAAAIEAIDKLGGATVALRPYDRDVSVPMGDHLFSLHGLAACEVQNGRISEIANDLALEAASNMEMPCVGTSSARGAEGLGTTATLFRRTVEDSVALIEALRHGECWPLSFSDTAPAEEAPKRDGRRRSEGKDGGGRRDGRRDGRRRRGGGRGQRGGGGAGRGPVPDDIGNRAPGGRTNVPEDIGNRIRPESDDHLPPEDIGNRLAPGEQSPFRPRTQVDEEDD